MYKTELSTTESFNIISDMIRQAKSNYKKEGSFYFLLWGWVIAIANFSHYAIAKFSSFEMPFIVWLITIPAGIITGVYSYNQRKKALVTSHIDRIYGHVWIAAGIAIIISIIFMSRLEYNHSAVIMLLAGAGTYISGQMLKFNPLIFGSLALFIAGIICFNISPIDQMLVSGIAVIAGYLVPGYMLKSKEK